ncbi:hypothetical protein Bbelb_043840 [Branchiostoma belcheri]|nr:hypothetical protein Bbelb_043840 [Branchiostoma belcheri]
MASISKVCCKDKFLKEEVDPMLLTTLDDFTSSSSSSAEVSNPANFVRQNGAQFSVYSVDFDRRVLGLVRVRKGVNIKRSPFFFQAQRENAEELLLIPFDTLPAVADAVRKQAAAARNILLHNTGRCGSTLLCKAMEATTEVQAVSEPDMYTWIYVYAQVHDFNLTPAEEEDILMVLRCSTILLNFYLLQNDQSRPVICYKLRGFAIFIADLLQRAVPEAKTIFLYRDLPGFFDSWIMNKHQCRHIRLCPVRAKLTAPANDAGFRTAETISVHRGGFTLHDDKYSSYSRIQSRSGTKYLVNFAMSTLRCRLQQEFTG